jgi:anti-sigma factor RsiW
MKNNPSNPRESLWRRKLSVSERADLSAQPELELEARLTDALTKIPNATVPTNFTARVLEAVELEEKRTARSRPWTFNWRVLAPRFAVATVVLIFAGVSIQHYEASAHRTALARNIAIVTVAQPPPSVDALENLDAIQRMGQTGHADTDLLAALQ